MSRLQRDRISAIRVDFVLLDRLGDGLLIQNAVVGERLERCHGDIAPVDFEVLPERLARITSTK